MATYRWHPGRPAGDELRRIAQGQLERALDEVDDADPHAAVHAVRQRGKKLRALLRLVRLEVPELYDRENAAIRDATRRVAADRDEAVGLETFDTLVERYLDAEQLAGIEAVRDALVARRDAVPGADLQERLATVRAELEATLDRVESWQLDGEDFGVMAGALAKTYGRGRDQLERAYDQRTTHAFHQWRKRTKYHRYHLKLLQDAWPPVLKAQRAQLHELTDLLGDDHDLAVLREDLVAEPDRYGGSEPVATVCALLDRRRAELQADAYPLGRRCFAEPPDALVARFGGYWQAALISDRTGPLADDTVPSGA